MRVEHKCFRFLASSRGQLARGTHWLDLLAVALIVANRELVLLGRDEIWGSGRKKHMSDLSWIYGQSFLVCFKQRFYDTNSPKHPILARTTAAIILGQSPTTPAGPFPVNVALAAEVIAQEPRRCTALGHEFCADAHRSGILGNSHELSPGHQAPALKDIYLLEVLMCDYQLPWPISSPLKGRRAVLVVWP